MLLCCSHNNFEFANTTELANISLTCEGCFSVFCSFIFTVKHWLNLDGIGEWFQATLFYTAGSLYIQSLLKLNLKHN